MKEFCFRLLFFLVIVSAAVYFFGQPIEQPAPEPSPMDKVPAASDK